MNLHEEIAKLAYELYEKNGRASGMDLSHWLEAEKIVIALHNSPSSPALTGEPERRKGQRRGIQKGRNEGASLNPGSR